MIITPRAGALKRFLKDEDGAAAVEYVVIAAAMTLALVPGFYWVTNALQASLQTTISTIESGS
jgi:Flp pilus assembly pilin Flp